MPVTYQEFLNKSIEHVELPKIVEWDFPDGILINERDSGTYLGNMVKWIQYMWETLSDYLGRSITVRLLQNILRTEPNSRQKKNIFAGYQEIYRDISRFDVSWKHLITLGVDAPLFASLHTLYSTIQPYMKGDSIKHLYYLPQIFLMMTVAVTFFIALFGRTREKNKERKK